MTRSLRIAVLTLAALTGLLAVTVTLMATFDWNRAKPWMNERISAAAGRAFAIDGDLSVSWRRPPKRDGWRDWLPWPYVQATRVRLANPPWAQSGPQMAQVQALDLHLDPWPLLARRVRIVELRLTGVQLAFETRGEHRKNWQFDTAGSQPGRWRVDLQRLTVTDGHLRYLDANKHTDLQLALDTGSDGQLRWQADGRYNGQPLSGQGSAGALLTLRERGVRYPVDARLEIGDTHLRAQGSVTDPADPSALDIQLVLSGASMADLYPISGLLLPETPKFDTRGRVVGRLLPGRLDLRYENFSGRVGDSDIAGTLAYRQQAPRASLRGEVVSQKLSLSDLGRLIGSGKRPSASRAGEPPQPRGRVLPVSPFKTERWNAMDVDVRFTGRQIIREHALPIEHLDTRIRMQDGTLLLDPLTFGIAGGQVSGTVSINGQTEPAQGQLALTARRLALAKLFPAIGNAPASIGRLDGQLKMTASGNSVAALLGSASGELRAVAGRGTVSKFVLEAAGLNIANAAFVRLFGDRQVALNCLVADLQLKEGIALTRVFVLDTPDATINVTGAINLQGERYDLTVLPETKGVRVLSLRSPLYVQGSFGDPEVGVDKRSVALKAGAALALGAAAVPVAGLLALISPGDDTQSPCTELLQRRSR
jgi:uncharacterized protein involved in outer membrane biogenesis